MRPPHVYLWRGTLYRTDWARDRQYPKLMDRHVRWRNRAKLRRLSREACSRLEWMIYYERHDKNALQTARHYGIAPKTFWKWRKRFREDDLATLEEFSRVPLNKRTRTITQQEEVRVIDLRRTYLRYGKEKLARVYTERYGASMSAWKVQKTIEKHRLYYHPAKNARTQANAAAQRRKNASRNSRSGSARVSSSGSIPWSATGKVPSATF